MDLQVTKWGNSLAVRLPASYAKKIGIHIGDYLTASINKNGELHLVPNHNYVGKRAVLEKIRSMHQSFPRTTSVFDALRTDARY